jgi:indole-3-glycerol phosphate synthase/phosphoribosylanthranilate isomerase/anthranilate synthase/indole-3-glycerol phosphate synthase/phosphoribosylanthranilate isomerase
MPPRRTRVKICGLASLRDVELAVAAGADAIGVIVAESPRRVPLERVGELAAAIPPFVSKVGVMVNQPADVAETLRGEGFTLQFSGEESAAACERMAGGARYVKAFHLNAGSADFDETRLAPYAHALALFDSRVGEARGGTGVAFAWNAVRGVAARRAIVVSGGLTPENVGACVRALRPYAVDVRSGVETGGEKDPEKMRAFVRAVRDVDAEA